jgi:hypothetical protein
VNEFASPIPAAPPVDPPVRFRPLELANRLLLACGWGIAAIAAAVLVVAGAVAAATVAVTLGLAQGVNRPRERAPARRRTVVARTAELPTTLAKPDLG